MLRINLLPHYIHDGKKRTTALFAWIGGTVAVLAAFLFILGGISKNLADANARKDEADKQKKDFDANVTKIKNENDKVSITKSKMDFVADSQKNNEAWPDLYNKMRNLTSDQVLLSSMNIDAQTHKVVSAKGFTTSEANIIRWWMYLRNHKGADKATTFDQVTCTLPDHSYSPNAVAGGGGGGMGGGMMGAPASMGGAGMQQMMMGGRGAGMGGGMMGGGARGGGAPGAGAKTGGSAAQDEIEGRRGFSFMLSAVLKDPMNGGKPAPAWPAGTVAAGGGMGGGGMMGGGMMGGGMMGGGMGASMGTAGGAGAGGAKGGGAKGGAGGAE